MPDPRPKVLCAMSGGVDSSVAAALLVRAGYGVIGCFMRLGTVGDDLETPIADAQACENSGPSSAPPLRAAHRGCCSVADAADARLVAAALDIPLYVCNFKRDFARIIDYFADEYAAGRTPNPCVRCNDWLKFGKLHHYAQQLGAQFVASGHYARITPLPGGGHALTRARDPAKDQSYVLFGLPRAQLAHTLFPIGDMLKPDVRALARSLNLPVSDKPDSQDICFVPGNDYAAVVERARPALARQGPILDTAGRVVGTHAGQHRFTVGQRRGLGVALGKPLYVLHRDPLANSVTVGDREDLLARSCTAHQANWLTDPAALPPSLPVLAKYRYNSPAVPARLHLPPREADPAASAFQLHFDHPQPAVAPGQAVALYEHTGTGVVLGGGWIASVNSPPSSQSVHS